MKRPGIAARSALPTVLVAVLWLAGCGSDDSRPPPVTPAPVDQLSDPEPTPEPDPAPSEHGTLRALTYNVAGLPEAVSGEQPSTNAPLISPLLNAYDLVLLQEDWEDPMRQFVGPPPVELTAATLGYHHLIVAEAEHPFQSQPARHPLGMETRRGLDGVLGPTLLADGLNRLSRSAFGEPERILWQSCNGSFLITPLQELIKALGLGEFTDPPGLTGDEGVVDDGSSDCGAQKGFSVARHEFAPGVEVDVYNMHADAGSHDLDLQTRADNFRQLADFIVNVSAGRAIILGGDTNLRFDSMRRETQRESDGGAWHDFLAATGLTDVCAVLDCGDVDTLVAQKPQFKVHDRFAFRSGGGIELAPLEHRFERERFTREDGERMSDHDPVAVTFDWRLTP